MPTPRLLMHFSVGVSEPWISQVPKSAPVGGLVGTQVDAGDVLQLVLGPPPRRWPVGEHHRGAPHAEQRVGDEHAAVVARVPVQRDVLGGHHQRIGIALYLHRVTHSE